MEKVCSTVGTGPFGDLLMALSLAARLSLLPKIDEIPQVDPEVFPEYISTMVQKHIFRAHISKGKQLHHLLS